MTKATDQITEATDALRRFGQAMLDAAYAAKMPIERANHVAAKSQAAREALADYLIARDWPSATPREISVRHRYRYGVMAAAILNGEAWAIRQAWPEGAYDIESTRRA